jgi:hypothetical protein
MNVGDIVILNEGGLECYNINKNYKRITPGKRMTIIEHVGFDGGREIYRVECDGETDVYFGCHLVGDKGVRGDVI